MKKISTLLVICFAIGMANAQLLKNDFLSGYNVGDDLEKGAYTSTTQGDANPIQIQWNRSGKIDDNNTGGANPKVVAPLTYAGYTESGKDVAIDLLKLDAGGRTSIYSLSNNVNDYGAGTYYLAFMTNVTTAGAANEFFSLDGNYTGNAQRVRFTVKGIDETTTYQIGISGDASAAKTLAGTFNYGDTQLIVIKVVIDGEGTGSCVLFINPAISENEPGEAFASAAIEGTALKSIRGFVVRQRTTLAAQIGGFRFAKTWKDAVGYTPSVGVEDHTVANSIVANGNTLIANQNGHVNVYSITGNEILSQPIFGSLETGLKNGMYIVRFTDENGKNSVSKVLIK